MKCDQCGEPSDRLKAMITTLAVQRIDMLCPKCVKEFYEKHPQAKPKD